MNTAKIGKMQSSMSNQKTTTTLPTSGQQADFGGGGADYSDFESMFGGRSARGGGRRTYNWDRILMLNSILT
jgi:hypothetical protein